MMQGPRSRRWIKHYRLSMCLLLPLLLACSSEDSVSSSDAESDLVALSPQESEGVDDVAAMHDLKSSEGNLPGATAQEVASFEGKIGELSSGEDSGDALSAPSFYTVAYYDTQADPSEQLKETLARASSEGKTVLLQVGGDWCVWCKRMSGFIADNPAVNSLISEHYLIQKVTYDADNPNETFLSTYPKINGYPHLFVLDASGNLLHSQDTAELEEGQSYSEQAFVAFLNKWQPNNSD